MADVDVRADEMVALATGPLPEAVPRVLDVLGTDLGADHELCAAVLAGTEEFGAGSRCGGSHA